MADEQFLMPTKTYLKAGIHIGTKFKTKYMEKFIYKIRPDGLCVLNLEKVDERIRTMISFLSQYEPEDIILISKRENGWKALKMVNEMTGIRVFPGRYPPGILTNPNLESFMEAKVIVVTDSWPDRNAIGDALHVGIPVVALCDTNNQSNNIDLVIPCNNKGKKSLGLLFYIFARDYMKAKGMIKDEKEMKYDVEVFMEE
ncbi:30S ribosomal protein S2 [Candidatus Woesearchaeota archaeon]|jgi:small subunit ribosomal protein S2|nr:30S ribosomal protein S2 [Candidatus Woesearchaeota archaeon]MBT5272707.1 30S ribosomal protein S2 [Candidatus Woesearchaeota archaeon]MBT6040318.1 30S ribosomal protein S2 [Candidatus Woesearchaeota archaeon]MBT6337048.1 30S ribosomal protein S2 [Candidatus Woesearchaeota archaeon]MBT7927898.1 30S ribosomal protein S2 [Candidatus Woesearchaeota archaeon]